MRPLSQFSVLVLALMGCRADTAQFTARDHARIREMLDARVGYLRAGDWVKWSLQHADSAIVQPANASTLKGRGAILAWGQSFPPIDSIDLSDIRISGEGSLAYATDLTSLKLRGQPWVAGKELLVFRRSPGGEWQVVAFSVGPDLPPSMPAVPGASVK